MSQTAAIFKMAFREYCLTSFLVSWLIDVAHRICITTAPVRFGSTEFELRILSDLQALAKNICRARVLATSLLSNSKARFGVSDLTHLVSLMAKVFNELK